MPNRPAKPNAPRSSYRGHAAMEKSKEVHTRIAAEKEARKNQKHSPFRFYVPVGESRQIVIVDELPDFFRNEHALMNASNGRRDNFVPCINEFANCPVCSNAALQSRPYWAMYLTILDLEPYVNRAGEEVPWSKKLLVVKPTSQPKIMRLFERHGTLRGMILTMARDNDKDPAIGNDIIFEDFMPEEELDTYITSYQDKDGNEHDVFGNEAFDYEEIMPELTERQLAAIAGTPMEDGGRRTARPAAGSKAQARGVGRRAAEEYYEDGEEEAEQEEAPAARRSATNRTAAARTARTPTERPAARSASRRAPVDEEEYVEEEEAVQEEPAPRRAPAARGKAAPPAGKAGRASSRMSREQPVDDEPPFDADEEEEEAPAARRPAGKVNPAERRAQLRGGRR